jgi:hypothetical protein
MAKHNSRERNTAPCGKALISSCKVFLNGSILAGTIAILSNFAFKSALGGFVSLYWYGFLSA